MPNELKEMGEEEILALAQKVKDGAANFEERTALLAEMNKIISKIEETLHGRKL